MKGYKFLLKGYKAQYGNFKYEVGKTYKYERKIKLCESGFHFSKKLKNAIKYINGDHVVEVEGRGEIIEGSDKVVCSEIEIKKELDIVEVLSMLSKDEDSVIRCRVAENNNTSREILEILSRDKNSNIKRKVALNNNTSKEILEVLSKDENWNVKYFVALNNNTPKEILEILSKDENWYVRSGVACNKSIPIKILKILSRDEYYYVRNNAMNTLNICK